ncbi:MAG: diguanylate cyclase [Desulfobulbaceae bacterium]|nr:diguanylate cyclase [Desulfobulbaceae bacterium]
MSDSTFTNVIDSNIYLNKDFEKKVPVLTCMTGVQVGRRIMLADDRITFGRSPEATIMLRDDHVSRIHFAVEYDPQHSEYRVMDLGSSNGTLVNEKKIFEAVLKNFDKITAGVTRLRFSWEDALDVQYQAELDQLLNIDSLTGLVVKRRFDEELHRHVAVATKKGGDLAMIMMDLDGVKQINDTHGHAFGAYTISETGKLIKSIIGQIGLASRFGGDEFMAFLPNVQKEEALMIGELIRKAVENHAYEKNDIRLKPTISIGISLLQRDDDVESLLNRADVALYRSKKSGRNKVSFVD